MGTYRSVTCKKSEYSLNINSTQLLSTYDLLDAANTEPEKLPWATLPAVGSWVSNGQNARPLREGGMGSKREK